MRYYTFLLFVEFGPSILVTISFESAKDLAVETELRSPSVEQPFVTTKDVET